MILAFVTPVYKRFELTAICFDQRALVIERLAAEGIEAVQVVVGDDENLVAADARGFFCVERDNEYLGRKFNDGWEFACRDLDADWITPIGSDSWVKPEVFLHAWRPHLVYSSPRYCVVDERGERLLVANVADGRGAGPHVFHRSFVEPLGFRPSDEERNRGIDGSTLRNVARANGRPLRLRHVDLDDFQYVGFRSEQNITPYEKLRSRWGVRETSFLALSTHYPDSVVRAVDSFYDAQISAGLA